ncbi:MAG: hypothetical protein WCN88_03920 [Candidatus Falkowbacteria bacterium]
MVSKNRLDSIESAKTSLSAAEIKKWDEKISQAKTPKEKTAIRADFKKTHNISFSQNLVKEILEKENPSAPIVLTPEPVKSLSSEPVLSASVEPILNQSPEGNKNRDFETVQAEVRGAVIKLDDLVASQKSTEDQEATGVADPELLKAANQIDEDRDQTVAAAKDALDSVANPDEINLSDAEKVEIELLDDKIEELGTAYIIRMQRLGTSDLSPEEKSKLEQESLELEDQMAEAINQKNAIKGIITPEPETTPEPLVEPTPASPEPEPLVEPGVDPGVEPTPAPSPEAENKQINAIDKFREFNISKEELEGIKEFSDLSEGQRQIVFEGLKQMSLVYVKDTAKENVAIMRQEKMRPISKDLGLRIKIGRMIANAFDGTISSLTKKYNTADQEKKLTKEIKKGGFEFHSRKIEEITSMISALNIDVEVYDGEAFVNYLREDNNYNEAENNALFRFNSSANRFREIPYDWSLATASKENKETYDRLEQAYEKKRHDALNVIGAYHSHTATLLEIQKVDSQIRMMQALMADPLVNEEFEKIEKKSVFSKTISSEVAARGSYMAGGFVTRHSLAGAIGFGSGIPLAAASFAAMPLAAAGIGAWRAHDRAKTSLNEKDITGRKNDNISVSNIEMRRKYLVAAMNNIVPVEYSVTPLIWYDNIATEDQKKEYDAVKDEYRAVMSVYQEENEKGRDKTAKNFSDSESLTNKLQFAINKIYRAAAGEDYLTNLHYLRVRVQFTEDKLADGLVNFGKDTELSGKFELIQALSEARRTLLFNRDDLAMKDKELLEEKEKESPISHDMQERFEKMFNLKYAAQDKQIESERKKYVGKQMLYGAGIGATFAIGGVLIRELAVHFGIIGGSGSAAANSNHQVEQPSTDAKASALESQDEPTADSSNLESSQAVSDTTNISNNVVLPKINGGSIPTEEAGAGAGTSVVENASTPRAGSGGIENFSNDISTGDSVWRSTREIFKGHAEELGYKGDLNDATALSKWAETQTANTLHDTGEFTDKVFVGNKILLEKNDAGEFIVKVEAGTGATPGFSEATESLEPATSSGTSTESADEALAESLKFKLGAGDTEIIPEPSKPLNFPEFFKQGNGKTLAQMEKLGWKVNGNNLDYGGKNVIAFDDATREIKITGDGGDGTRLLIINKDGSMQGLLKIKGEFREVDMKTDQVIGAGAKESLSGASESALSASEALARQNGFTLQPSNIISGDKLMATLANHDVVINLKDHSFEYEWNGETHHYPFQAGEAARANIEKFLAEHGQIEKIADGIQNNLMTGKTRSFSALQNQLEEMNGATKLTDGEKTMWREIYADNFAKKSSNLLDDSQKLKVLRTAMNSFLSGGAK